MEESWEEGKVKIKLVLGGAGTRVGRSSPGWGVFHILIQFGTGG